jgi:hypothetical protein
MSAHGDEPGHQRGNPLTASGEIFMTIDTVRDGALPRYFAALCPAEQEPTLAGANSPKALALRVEVGALVAGSSCEPKRRPERSPRPAR